MAEKEKESKTEKTNFDISIEEMSKAGVYFGHRASKRHPKMKPYLVGVKGTDRVDIINLEATKEKLEKALSFIQQLIQENKTLLLVGTKIPLRGIVEETAKECGLAYVSHRWLGGTITNFPVIKKRIEYFRDLEDKKKKGELDKYTKKERWEFDKELERLELKFGGIKNLEKIPDAIFVVDMKKDELAIREAKRKKIPVIGIADTNVDPSLIDYPIPANDDAISSVKYILGKVKKVVLKSKVKNENQK